MNPRRIRPVILCGGAGSRLWPVSTPAMPKPFLPLLGERTMLQMTAQRVADPATFSPPVIVAAEAHRDLVERQLEAAGIAPSRIILEPCGRGTAAAAALAAMTAERDEQLLLMPSDHLIAAPERLIEAEEAARPLVADGWLVTFGVVPTRAETGYGYIQSGEELAPGVRRAARFVEKPDAARAAAMLAEGGYHWNSGLFLFAAGAFLDRLAIHAPDIAASVEQSLSGRGAVAGVLSPEPASFAACRAESIDRAVMERAERIAVAPAEMGWSDVGSWDALAEASLADGDGNLLSGPAAAVGSRSCLVRSEGPRVLAIGVEDLIVVATGDSVLVVRRGRSQEVGDAAERLAGQPGERPE